MRSSATDLNGDLAIYTDEELDELTTEATLVNDGWMVKLVGQERCRRLDARAPEVEVDDYARRVGSIRERQLDFSTWEDEHGRA